MFVSVRVCGVKGSFSRFFIVESFIFLSGLLSSFFISRIFVGKRWKEVWVLVGVVRFFRSSDVSWRLGRVV